MLRVKAQELKIGDETHYVVPKALRTPGTQQWMRQYIMEPQHPSITQTRFTVHSVQVIQLKGHVNISAVNNRPNPQEIEMQIQSKLFR